MVNRLGDGFPEMCLWSVGEIEDRFDRQLPGLREAGARIVWLRPAGGAFSADHITAVAAAARPGSLIAWRPSNSEAGAASIPPEDLVARLSVEIGGTGLDYKSTVKWVRSDEHAAIAELLRDYQSGIVERFRVAMAAIPHDSVAAMRFSKAVLGPAWLWTGPEWIANEPISRFRTAPVVAGYIVIVCALKGLAFLTWIDEWDRTGLAAIGSEHQVDRFASGLRGQPGFVRHDDLLQDCATVGVRFKMSPQYAGG